jgi:hypothetical protein
MPKIPIWVNIGGPWNDTFWNILWLFGILTDIRYVLFRFCDNLVLFSPILVYCTKKNLATLG